MREKTQCCGHRWCVGDPCGIVCAVITWSVFLLFSIVTLLYTTWSWVGKETNKESFWCKITLTHREQHCPDDLFSLVWPPCFIVFEQDNMVLFFQKWDFVRRNIPFSFDRSTEPKSIDLSTESFRYSFVSNNRRDSVDSMSLPRLPKNLKVFSTLSFSQNVGHEFNDQTYA